MDSTPVVSVHMPVYNARRYLAQALDSILQQTFEDFEFLIIDDGSTDDSLSILQSYAAKDERIRLRSRPNRGITSTRNEALALARGEFFAVMDADDVSRPDRFVKQVDFLSTSPEYVAVGCRVLLIDPDGEPICEVSCERSHEDIDAAHLRGHGGIIAHPASMMRREAVLAVGGYREQFQSAEDLDLFLRLAEYGKVANLSDVLHRYRQHLESASHARQVQDSHDVRQVVEEAHARRGLSLAADEVLDQIERSSPSAYHRKWAWWALQAGHVSTARKHALAALKRSPFSPRSWQTTFCAIRGR